MTLEQTEKRLKVIEQRIEFVEKEMKLLKAQIQATLLEIRDHILNGTYPTLQAESKSEMPSDAASKQWPVKKFTIGQEDSTPSYYGDEAPLEPAHAAAPSYQPQPSYQAPPAYQPQPTYQAPPAPQPQMSDLDMRRDSGNHNVKPEGHVWKEILNLLTDAYPMSQFPETDMPTDMIAEQATDLHLWLELDKWVTQKIREIGIEATRELVDLYSGEERRLLLKLLKIYEKKPASAPSQSSQSYSSPSQRRASAVTEQTRQAVAEQWLKYADANRERYGNRNGQGDDEELVMRFITHLLNSGATVNVPLHNGNGNGNGNGRVSNGYSRR